MYMSEKCFYHTASVNGTYPMTTEYVYISSNLRNVNTTIYTTFYGSGQKEKLTACTKNSL